MIANLDTLSPDQLRDAVRTLMADVASKSAEIAFKQATIDKLAHEMAVLKRLKFAARSEAFNAEQKSLIEETIDTDLAALALEIEQRAPSKDSGDKQQPKRAALPADLPRTEHHHEPENTACSCGCQLKRIGEDVAEKLDYVPGVFTVERHIRGKWVCTKCETLVQAPVPAHIIDKGIPTTGLLAQVLVAKYQDHLPLYRQEHIFGRAGLAIPRSTLASWVGQCGVQLQPLVDALKAVMLKSAVLHADETPVAMLKPGNKKTHRAYIWTYCTTPYDALKAVVFDFAEGRGGQHVRGFPGLDTNGGKDGWHGKLVCDDFSGYNACFELGVTEVGCLAHARRKFHELWVNHGSQVGERALKFFGEIYDIEREVQELEPDERRRIRQQRSAKVARALHQWLEQQRKLVPEGSATAKAIDYSLKRWKALTRFIDDGELPADNNWVENQIRPIAIGRSNWLFAGSLRAGQRAAAVMSLLQSARLNGLDPYSWSAQAAREIKGLIASSLEQVEAGTTVVRGAGSTIEEIVSSSQRVDRLLGEVATGAREQSLGVGQIGQAVQELDRMTQQNAAMVEQTAAAASAMKEQAHTLADEVARFKIPDELALTEASRPVTDFDFDKAIEAHRQWKVRLRKAISDRDKLDSDTICRDDQCPLGKWIHGPGGAQWGSRPSFVELMKKHAEFHRTAGSVAKQINGGHYAEAERLIGSGSQFALASNEVATILMRAKRGL